MLVLNCDHVKAKNIERATTVLQSGGVIVYPTDTVYGMGCDLLNPQAIDRVYSIKKIHRRKPLSLICSDLNQIAQYAQLTNTAYKLMRQLLPGPYTFVLQATRLVPRIMMTKQRTVGIRVPDNEVCLSIVRGLGNPLVNTSATGGDEEPVSSPEAIQKNFPSLDLILDAGLLTSDPSTVIDLSKDPPVIIREGKGPTDGIFGF